MGRRIVSTGRGDGKKTSFAALATKYLAVPLLLIDIDPDQSLADALRSERPSWYKNVPVPERWHEAYGWGEVNMQPYHEMLLSFMADR